MNGRNVPKKKKKLAMHKREKDVCFNGRMNSITSIFCGLGLSLDFTVRFVIISIPRMTNAQMRIVHGKPTSLISLGTMIGKITPPRLDPEAMMPNEAALFLKNQVPTDPVQALNTMLEPKELTNP